MQFLQEPMEAVTSEDWTNSPEAERGKRQPKTIRVQASELYDHQTRIDRWSAQSNTARTRHALLMFVIVRFQIRLV